MMNATLIRSLTVAAVLLASSYLQAQAAPDDNASAKVDPNTETIVVVRHGEKPAPEARGQLSCQGLNRALSLPAVLARFGHPAAIFAPNPSVQTSEGNPMPWATRYSYVRPLATIEPYAISLGMPVNAQIAASDIRGLQREVLKPEFAHSVVVIAWEHLEARSFAELMLSTFGLSQVVPHWENSDYETIYVFRLKPDGKGNRKLTFTVEHEELNNLPTACFTVPPANKPMETKPALDPAASDAAPAAVKPGAVTGKAPESALPTPGPANTPPVTTPAPAP